ncbi:MAG TPA: response regulator transcription factor [Gemmatimonadales bacterium]|jgi:two-component system response regulator NreC|nr:response regulator transcription factor [Gemmatimonadales bacterium]
MSKIRVLVADDHAVLRAGLKLLIGAQPDMEVVSEAGSGPEAVRGARETAPHIVLLDLTMPGARSTQTIEDVVRVAPKSRVLVLTMHDDSAYLQAALQAGASGYIVKKAADVELLTAIRAVHEGRTFVDLSRPLDPGSADENRIGLRDSPAGGSPRPLSRRETEVLRLLAQGHTNQQAADRLAVSVKTIETHRQRLSDKLGLKSRSELFRYAVEIGLLESHAASPGDG